MAEIPHAPWTLEPGVWDTIAFDDEQCPGLATITVSRSNKWDTKKAQGSHGGERDFKGADLAAVKIQIRIWTADQHVEFCERVLPLIEPNPGKQKPKAVRVEHATAWARKLEAVTIDTLSGPDVQGGVSVWDIDATEYRKPDSNNAKGKPGTGKGNCASLAAQRELIRAQLTVQYSLRSVYYSPFSLDLDKAKETDARIAILLGEDAAVQGAQLASKCFDMPPGGFMPPGSEEESSIFDDVNEEFF